MVLEHMMHGPCGDLNPSNVCMKNGKCKSHYPRKYTNETIIAPDGYPMQEKKLVNK